MTAIVYPTTGGRTWPAVVTIVHDGDTVGLDVDLGRPLHRTDADADLGFHVYIEQHGIHIHQALRLIGINAPELSTPEGKAAHEALAAKLPVGTTVTLTSWLNHSDKYGRLLGQVVAATVDINQWLVDGRWAAPWDGSGPKPLP